MRPDISVCIPSFNGALTIERAVTAARKQGAEVIVCDDGSTDDTAALAQAAGAIVVRHPRNCGQVAALNTATEAAQGRYLMFHGDDDWLVDGCLSEMVRTLDQAPINTAFAYGGIKYWGMRSDITAPPPFRRDDYKRYYACGNGMIFRRSVWDAGARYREFGAGVVADYDFALQMVLSMGLSGVLTPVIVLNYTLSPGRDWARLQANKAQVLAALKAVWPELEATDL